MRTLTYLFIILFVVFLIVSCDTTNEPSAPTSLGGIYLTSNPAGAEIWLDGVNTLKVTPDTVKNIEAGVHNVTLKLQEYQDTTFAVNVSEDQTKVVANVVLVSNVTLSFYGPNIRIYETLGTDASQPNGLDLSSGNAWGISSDSSGLVDIYYSTEGTGGQGFLIQSADLYLNLFRETDFQIGSGSNIFDGEDSPKRNTGTWTNNISDTTTTNYIFLYDHDGHYSKLKIVNSGGGVAGEPAWVEVQWYYNEIVLDNRF